MARMTCSCGEELSNGASPNNIQLRVYTDEEWESIYVYEDGNDKPVMIYRLEK